MLLPEDPDTKHPIIMGDPYANALTPKLAQQKRNQEFDSRRRSSKYGDWDGYAHSTIAHSPDPWVKTSQMTGVSNMMTQPMWFSPLHTPQNWQIASKRREIYQWEVIGRCELLHEDFTFSRVDEFDFIAREQIEDTVTNGLLWEIEDSAKIMSGSGEFRQPVRFSTRNNDNKRCYCFSAYGNWRNVEVSEEHPMIVLDGELYRNKKKTESNARYRRSKGIEPNGVKKVDIPDILVGRKEAQNVSDQDYLLAPVPSVGKQSINNAWLLGLASADGHVSHITKEVNFTIGKSERFRSRLESQFSEFGKIRSKIHTSSKITQRITLHNKECHSFFSTYITGKLTEKRFTKNIFDLDKKSRLHVLGGYFDGDGSFSKREGKLIANNYSKDMADQLYWLLLSVGIRASLGRYPLYGDHYETDSKWVYRIFVPQSDILKLKPYMHSDKIPDDFMPRNTRELRFFYEEDGITYLAQPIETIKQFRYTGPGYDLQIDPERSFVASGFVTSNCRFFYENEPKVGAAIDFYSRFPMNGFELECPSRKVLSYFKHHVVDRLDLNEQFKMISSEYFSLGDVFVHMDVDCPVCEGSAVDPDTGEMCNHPGGNWKRMIILNPDWIEVQQSILADEPAIVMIPDEELKRIVFYKQPRVVYDRIPDRVKELVIQNKPIPLSNRTVSHIRHMPVPYGTYGTSLIRRLFTTLAYKTKIMTANWIVAERLILPVRVVKIGSDDRPATTADIADIQQQLAATSNDPNLTIVTHHNFDYEWYGASGKILQVTQEMEFIGKEILDGFMLNEAALNGEGPTYGNANIGIETLIRRIESWRHSLAKWCEENIFKPVAEMQGFVDKEKTDEIGELCFMYPKIKWKDLNLRDDTQWHQILMQLHDKQVISTQTLMEELDLNYDQEVKRMRYETSQGGALGAQAAGMGGMGGMGGGMGGPMGAPGGGAPGGDMGGPMGPGGAGLGGDMGGGMGAPGMGAPGAGGMGGMASGGGKIMKKGKGSGKEQEVDPEAMAAAMPQIRLTDIEQKMADLLVNVMDAKGLSKDGVRVQFPVENPKGGKPNVLDFALPHLKIGIECDGEMWHEGDEQEKNDQERDQFLAQRGWTILRFDDKVIDDAPHAIKSTISSYLDKAYKQSEKQASNSVPEIRLFTASKGKLIHLGQNYEAYKEGQFIYRSEMIGNRENTWDYRDDGDVR